MNSSERFNPNSFHPDEHLVPGCGLGAPGTSSMPKTSGPPALRMTAALIFAIARPLLLPPSPQEAGGGLVVEKL